MEVFLWWALSKCHDTRAVNIDHRSYLRSFRTETSVLSPSLNMQVSVKYGMIKLRNKNQGATCTSLHKHQFYRPWAIQHWPCLDFNVLYNHRRAVIFSIRGINTNHNSSHRAHSMNSRFNSVFLSSKTLIWKIGWSASASCTKISSCQIHLSPEHYYKQIISLTFHNRDIQWTAWAGNQQRGKTWYR